MKKLNFLFLGLLSFMPIWGCNDDDSLPEAVVEVKEGHNEDIVSVIDYDIKNDGTLIGSQLNNLVGQSYGKTLYFPAGTYNLTEPIVLPLEYTKNVNLIFDKNATVKSDVHLEALIKVGYSETYFTDVSHRRFSYIEGGILDWYNADNKSWALNCIKNVLEEAPITIVCWHEFKHFENEEFADRLMELFIKAKRELDDSKQLTT